MSLFINTEQIAQELDMVPEMSASSLMTGWFSYMDQCVLRLLDAYPQLKEAHHAFSQARAKIGPALLTDKTWEEMKKVASKLAEAVRSLGNINIPLCSRPTEYSNECLTALMANGTCPRNWHTI